MLLIALLSAASVMTYSFQSGEADAQALAANYDLSALELTGKFVQLQMNLRSMIDLANGAEPPGDASRMQYLNGLCSKLIEDIRTLTLLFKAEGNGEPQIVVTEID